jgi:hypothetical protein
MMKSPAHRRAKSTSPGRVTLLRSRISPLGTLTLPPSRTRPPAIEANRERQRTGGVLRAVGRYAGGASPVAIAVPVTVVRVGVCCLSLSG